MRRSKMLPQIGSNSIVDLYFLGTVCLLSCEQVQRQLFFQSEENFPFFRQSLKIIDSGLHIELIHNFIIQILNISWPWALIGSKLLIIAEITSVEKLTVSSDSFVSFARLLGKTLLLFNRVYWFAKKSIKKFSFLVKVCYKFIFMKQRKYTRNFFIIQKCF